MLLKILEKEFDYGESLKNVPLVNTVKLIVLENKMEINKDFMKQIIQLKIVEHI